MDMIENQGNNHFANNTSAAEKTASPVTVLSMLISGERYFVHMQEIGEVIQVPEIVPVPRTHSWFLGIINVHGNLYGITDLGVYLGGKPETFDAKSRILLVSSNYNINSGFVVSNLLGIRNLSEFKHDQFFAGQLPRGVTYVYKDQAGNLWYQLDLRTLIREKHFLQIAS